jgi:Raf kinase inhibitor-like YbhB/YbcL family protein
MLGCVSLVWTLGCSKKEPAEGQAHMSAATEENRGGDSSAAPLPTMMGIQIQSSAFMQGASIPELYTCEGKDMSPPLAWGEAPDGAHAWALIVDDPDAPSRTWVHWVIYNLPDSVQSLSAGIPGIGDPLQGGRQGKNDFGKLGYGGPCPPVGKPHRYFFRLYALDAPLNLPAGATRNQVDRRMEGHILGRGELMGTYARRR